VGWFIVSIVLVIVAFAAFVIAAKMRRSTDEEANDAAFIPKIVGWVIAIVGLVLFVLQTFTIVPPRNVGVPVAFGKAESSLDPGWHWIAPWASVETVDATVKNINLSAGADAALSKDNGNLSGGCVTVRLANQTTACVDVTAQWNVDQKTSANELWQRYRGTNDNVVENVAVNVVYRQLRVALNEVFESYNPLSVLTANAETPTVKTTDLAASALAKLKQQVDHGIVVDVLAIGIVHYDPVTQEKLNGYAQALADTQIATQQKLTAEQQKAANEKLAVASSNDPGVKYQNCLNMIKDLAAKNQLQNLQYGGLMCSTGDNSIIVGGSK
jgi:regulator of protease activity HflC (stomatin/prohibitin superfamily)